MRERNAVFMQQKKSTRSLAVGGDSKNTRFDFIFTDVFDEVKASVDILEVVKTYAGVGLRKHGKNYVALCPFHVERTPSFTVSPEKQVFYCFGCGAGGDVISFVAKLFKLRPLEAAQKIATDFGIALPNGNHSGVEVNKKLREIQRQRELESAFKAWQSEAYTNAASLFRNITKLLQLGGWEAYLQYSAFVHLIPLIENDLDLLAFGSEEEKLQLFLMRSERPWLR